VDNVESRKDRRSPALDGVVHGCTHTQAVGRRSKL
jgi:hypothetical protein